MSTRPLRAALLALVLAAGVRPVFGAEVAAPRSDFTQFDPRVDALLKQMTLEEKVGQLVQFSNGRATGPENVQVDQNELLARGGIGSILNATGAKEVNAMQRIAVEKSRLKIPVLMGLDVIHGYRTTFPVPIGLAATWDPALIEETSRAASVEATSEGIRWTFAPMVDIARDPRWGRVMEGSGEDTYLGEVLAAAYVRGFQGKDLSDPTSLLACAKHYVGYGGADGGRDYNSVDMSERMLRDVYLPPFKAAADAGVGTFMSAFNSLSGVPTSANHFTLTTVLRDEWRFNGFVVSDWTSIAELIPHGIALDGKTAAYKGFAAGVDMDMQANLYATYLPALVRDGKLKESAIDESVRRVLRTKFALGLFEHPYTDEALSDSVLLRADHVELARRAAEESFVLLKNDRAKPIESAPLLPLAAGKTIALIGPLADNADDMLGEWACKGDKKDVVTLKHALADRLNDKLIYAKGTEVLGSSDAGFEEAVNAAKRADVVIMAVGEHRRMSGEAASRTRLDLPGNQQALLKAVLATGKPVVLVVFSGRPLTLAWEDEHVPAILQAWHPGVQAGPALARTLFGETDPSGKLTVTFPRSVGQVPIYYNHFKTGRPIPGEDDDEKDSGFRYQSRYLDEKNSPLYPFGWGLTYTNFEYSPTALATSAKAIGLSELEKGAKISIEATVTNRGGRAGTEIAQLYIRQRGTSVARPVRELKGFEKFLLQPGESRLVKFEIGKEQLAFWNIDMQHTIEPAELTVWIAPSSAGGTPVSLMITE
ncbi:MAG: beta-glucosidase BglX [Phycisphaeraceae bacterium]|nr:beta-glucosidase BglX [Phycisphaeraceae bacterium]